MKDDNLKLSLASKVVINMLQGNGIKPDWNDWDREKLWSRWKQIDNDFILDDEGYLEVLEFVLTNSNVDPRDPDVLAMCRRIDPSLRINPYCTDILDKVDDSYVNIFMVKTDYMTYISSDVDCFTDDILAGEADVYWGFVKKYDIIAVLSDSVIIVDPAKVKWIKTDIPT